MNDIIEVIESDKKLAEALGYTHAEIAIVRDQVCKGATKAELAYFLNVCKSVGLNPFNKEIWAYKDGKHNLLVFTSRDGLLRKAQENEAFSGIRSSEVCINDDIILDIPNGVVFHKINPKLPRGNVIGAYCFVFRKNGEPTIEWAEFNTYNKGFNVWKSDPFAMIKKVAEAHALKKAFGLSGVILDCEYDNNRDEFLQKKEYEKLSGSELLKISKELSEIKNIEDFEKYYLTNSQKIESNQAILSLVTKRRFVLEGLKK